MTLESVFHKLISYSWLCQAAERCRAPQLKGPPENLKCCHCRCGGSLLPWSLCDVVGRAVTNVTSRKEREEAGWHADASGKQTHALSDCGWDLNLDPGPCLILVSAAALSHSRGTVLTLLWSVSAASQCLWTINLFLFSLSWGLNALGIMDPLCNLIWKLWTQLNKIIMTGPGYPHRVIFSFLMRFSWVNTGQSSRLSLD